MPHRTATVALVVASALSGWTGTLRAQERTRTLAEVLEHADRHAPLVVVARARLSEAAAEREGAEPLLVEPLGVQIGAGPRMQDGGTADADVVVALSQPIELAGQRGARLALAGRIGERRSAELEVARWQAHREVHFAFHEAIEMRVRRDAARRWRELAVRVAEIARARTAAGEAALVEAILAEAELARAEQELVRAEHAFEAAVLVVCERSGWPASDPPYPAGELDAPRPIAPLETLLSRALQAHPSVRARELAAQEARARAALADREAWPPIDVGLSFAREGSAGSPANYVGLVTLGVALPVWQQAARERALARSAIAIADAETEALRGAIEAQVRRARAAAVAASERVAIYVRDVLPRFERNLQALQHAYEVGEIDASELAAARRALMAAQDDALAAFAEYHRALAELEAQVGAEVVADVGHGAQAP